MGCNTMGDLPHRSVFPPDPTPQTKEYCPRVRGNLPQGLTLREQVMDGKPVAVIEGTPTQTGEFIFVVSVLDWRGRGYQWIRMVVE